MSITNVIQPDIIQGELAIAYAQLSNLDPKKWLYQFGKNKLLRRIPGFKRDSIIMEITCGNDNEPRVTITDESYGFSANSSYQKADVLLFSYSLSWMSSLSPQFIDQAKENLRPGGYIAIVDFENSRFEQIKQQMVNHKIRLNNPLLTHIEKNCRLIEWETKSAYGGLWEYFMYIGKKYNSFLDSPSINPGDDSKYVLSLPK
jgi:hypothetical protein